MALLVTRTGGPASGWGRLRGDDEKLVELPMIVGEDVVEPGDLRDQWGVGTKPEQDDAGVGLSVLEHQLAKIPVVGDEDAPPSSPK